MTTIATEPTLLHGFLRQASDHPNRVAIIDGPRRIRYRDLARAAEVVRRDLAAAGVNPGDYVGIRMRRSWRVIAAIVGVLAAGARYVPLDPGYPRSRLDFIAADCGLRVVCADPDQRDGHDGRSVRDGHAGLRQTFVSGDLAEAEVPADAADSSGYVIYTSGSTGRPKGVIIPQRNVLNLFDGATRSWFSFSSQDVWTFFHSYSFDFSVWEIWGALLFGGTLVVVDDATKRDPGRLLDLMAEHRVSVLSQVPSPFKYLTIAYEQAPRPLRSLRYVVFGGEALDKPSVRSWLSLRDGPEQLINMYGITETTVHVTAAVIGRAEVTDDSAPATIGWPLPHLDIALVTPDGSVAEPGQPGEIWVTGTSLSPGYVGLAEVTAAKFVTRDLGGGGRHWYRSGDLACRNPGGDLRYLGRIDSQVNLRGFRIELGEIEAVLRADGGVLDAAAAVATLPGDEQTLIAAVVLAEDRDGQSLRDLCRAKLPGYMIPDRVIVVGEIPVTHGGGKVDRNAVAALAHQ